ncbi:periplasmic binding protein-like I [Obelidium mucronatum]|nr:periplasmic binding protein-like I [Obelidium mucronatum]
MASNFSTTPSITIAFVGPYSWYPGLSFDGSLVSGGWDQLDKTQYKDFYSSNFANYFFWYDFGASLAVSDLNNNWNNILPGVTINIKRFNNYDPRQVSEEMSHNSADSGGFATKTVQAIYEDHPDVIAIFGDYLVNTAMYTAAVSTHYKIPYINPAAWSYPLLDRNKYGYAIQMDTMFGMGQGLFLLLKEWNVKRVAIMYPAHVNSWASVTQEIIRVFQTEGISILAVIDMDIGETKSGIEYIAQSLKRVDARYIIAMSDFAQVGHVYYSLAMLNASVGNDYVWLGMNVPVLNSNATVDNDPEYYKMGRGFVAINGYNNPNDFMADHNARVLEMANNITVPLGVVVDDAGAWYDNLYPSYDCIMLLAYAFNNLVQGIDNGLHLLQTRKLSPLMNSTLFMNTGYRGSDGDPLLISEQGDLRSTYNFYSLIGNSPATDAINFGGTDMSLTKFSYLETPPLFFDGTSTPPHDGSKTLTELLNSVSSPFGEILITLIVIGWLSCTALGIISLLYRNVKIIKKGSTVFTLIQLLGSILIFVGELSYLGRVTVSACTLRVWMFILGLTLSTSSFVLKNMRVYLIFNAKKNLPKYIVKDGIYLTAVICLASLATAVLAAWTMISIPTVTLIQVSSDKFTYACAMKNKNSWPEHLLWVFMSVLVSAQGLLGFATLNVGAAYNQSSSLYTLAFLIALCGLLLFGPNEDALFHSILSQTQAICVWVLAIIQVTVEFAPKFINLWNERKVHLNTGSNLQSPSQTLSRATAPQKIYVQPIAKLERFTGTLTVKNKKSIFWNKWIKATLVLYQLHQSIHLTFLPLSKENAFAIKLESNLFHCSLGELENEVVLVCRNSRQSVKIVFDTVEGPKLFIGLCTE